MLDATLELVKLCDTDTVFFAPISRIYTYWYGLTTAIWRVVFF